MSERIRWDLVHKWSDQETLSIVDKVVNALEVCDRKLTEAVPGYLATHPFLVDLESEEAVKELAEVWGRQCRDHHAHKGHRGREAEWHEANARAVFAAWRSLRDAR